MKRPRNKDPSLIPEGMYCYTIRKIYKNGKIKVNPCPYLEFKKDKPNQEKGYCHYLEKGDWEDPGNSLLWDMCKECGISFEG